MNHPSQIVIAEDNPAIRAELIKIIDASSEFQVEHTVAGVKELLALSYLKSADILILDLELEDANSLYSIAELRKEHPQLHILVYSVLEDSFSIIKAIQDGAAGYLIKGTSAELLLHELKTVAMGGSAMSPEIAKKLTADYILPDKKKKSPLTRRENEVINLVALGLKYSEIAEELVLSPHTVRTVIKNIYDKLKVNSKSQAVAKSGQLGLLNRWT